MGDVILGVCHSNSGRTVLLASEGKNQDGHLDIPRYDPSLFDRLRESEGGVHGGSRDAPLPDVALNEDEPSRGSEHAKRKFDHRCTDRVNVLARVGEGYEVARKLGQNVGNYAPFSEKLPGHG